MSATLLFAGNYFDCWYFNWSPNLLWIKFLASIIPLQCILLFLCLGSSTESEHVSIRELSYNHRATGENTTTTEGPDKLWTWPESAPRETWYYQVIIGMASVLPGSNIQHRLNRDQCSTSTQIWLSMDKYWMGKVTFGSFFAKFKELETAAIKYPEWSMLGLCYCGVNWLLALKGSKILFQSFLFI